VRVEVDSIVVEFSGVRALDGVTCGFRAGVVNGLIGPNGAGKSTLLNTLSGVVRPVGGTLTIGGAAVAGSTPEKVHALGVTRTFQVPKLHAGISVLDNVVLGVPRPSARARAWAPWRPSPALRARREVAAEWLDRFGSPQLRAARVADLTLPEQRVVELVRALVGRPGLVMLDEPSSGLGIDEAKRILVRGRELLPRDGTMILVSHDVELVFALARWIVVMAEGRVLAQGEPEEVRSDARVREAYLGVQHAA
jgi:branched-chain amino acid transport system ATP-binding protein